jgi:hypothetical protein
MARRCVTRGSKAGLLWKNLVRLLLTTNMIAISLNGEAYRAVRDSLALLETPHQLRLLEYASGSHYSEIPRCRRLALTRTQRLATSFIG